MPRHPGGGHARRGTSRQRAHKPRLRAPHRRIPPLLTLPQHIYYSTFRPKRKGFSFIIIVFCGGWGKNVVFGQSGCVRFCRETVQAAWVSAAKGSRGRPQSPLVASADAKPLRNKKVQLVLTPKSNEIKRNQMKSKAPPHNSAARLSMSFPPSAACKFLDLPPVNLRNLHLHLTKNPFASRPPHLCGVTQISLTNIHSPFYNITVAIAANNIRKE